jgi:hypothetical protein
MEVKRAPLFRLEPSLYLGALVGAVVVHNEVDLLIGRKLPFQVIEEANELVAAAVALLAGADYLAANRVMVPYKKPL